MIMDDDGDNGGSGGDGHCGEGVGERRVVNRF